MSTAKEVLESFISEMKNFEIKWDMLEENKGIQWIASDNGSEKRLEDVITIQDKYLSKKALSLGQGRRIALQYGTPPEYNQIIADEKIMTKNKIEFTTIRNDDPYRIFTVIKEEDGWKVDKMAIAELDWKVSRTLF